MFYRLPPGTLVALLWGSFPSSLLLTAELSGWREHFVSPEAWCHLSSSLQLAEAQCSSLQVATISLAGEGMLRGTATGWLINPELLLGSSLELLAKTGSV